MRNVLFLGAYTPRSQAYAQAMAKAGLLPAHALLFGSESCGIPGQSKKQPHFDGRIGDFLIPDFGEHLNDTFVKYKIGIKKISQFDVNDILIYNEIISIKPKLIVYSGYGGQLVGRRLLKTEIPFLHIHGGWVPDYKGSTTLYYSWLKDNFCGASAIILTENIDRGPIVARKKYPPPPPGMDPDYVYDSIIRADLLVKALKEFFDKGEFKNVMQQPQKGKVYFVIHPLLKHLARLRSI